MKRTNYRLQVSLYLATILFSQQVAFGQSDPKQTTQRTVPPNAVIRFIDALQKRDYKTIIDLSYDYQAGLSQIKAGNPQVLWSKLIAEFYDKRISDLSKNPDLWGSYFETMGGMFGDPAQALRIASGLVPTSSKWKITETRSSLVQQNVLSEPHQATITYVAVDYISPAKSPIVSNKRLAKAILQFDVDQKSQLIRSVTRLSAGDEFWPIPILNSDAALNMIKTNTPGDRLYPFIVLIRRRNESDAAQLCCLAPTHAPQVKVEYESFLRRQFNVGATIETDRESGTSVQPTESWNKYWIACNYSQSFCYRLNESSTLEITNLKRSELTAEANLHVVNSGCSPACSMIKEYYALDLGRFENGSYLFAPRWPTNSSNDGGARWPAEENGIARYEWDAGNLTWKLIDLNVSSVGPSLPAPGPEPFSQPPPTDQNQHASEKPAASPTCHDYDSCAKDGFTAFKSSQWDKSLVDFQEASKLDPTKGDVWALIGTSLFELGRYDEVAATWDKALHLGTTMGMNVCVENVPQCDMGQFRMNIKEISFVNSKGQTVFRGPIDNVISREAFFSDSGKSAYLSLTLVGRTYNLFMIPEAMTCTVASHVQCLGSGLMQQKAFADYVHQAIVRIRNGELK